MRRSLYVHTFDEDRAALGAGRWFPAAGVIEVPADSVVLGQVISSGVSPLARAAAQISSDRTNWSKPIQWSRYKETISLFGAEAAAFTTRMPAVTEGSMSVRGTVLIRPGVLLRPGTEIGESPHIALSIYVRTGRWVPGSEPLAAPGGKSAEIVCPELRSHISNLEGIISHLEAGRDPGLDDGFGAPTIILPEGVPADGEEDARLAEVAVDLIQLHRADLVDAETVWADRDCDGIMAADGEAEAGN